MYYILDQRLRGSKDIRGESNLMKIEANVKRSVTRTVKDEKKKGSTPEEAKVQAETNALALVEKYGFETLTEHMSKHIDETLAKVYGLKSSTPRR